MCHCTLSNFIGKGMRSDWSVKMGNGVSSAQFVEPQTRLQRRQETVHQSGL